MDNGKIERIAKSLVADYGDIDLTLNIFDLFEMDKDIDRFTIAECQDLVQNMFYRHLGEIKKVITGGIKMDRLRDLENKGIRLKR